jgi:hypothetical protein
MLEQSSQPVSLRWYQARRFQRLRHSFAPIGSCERGMRTVTGQNAL